MESIVPLLVALPLGAAFLAVALPHGKGVRHLTTPLCLAAVLANLVLSLLLLRGQVAPVFVGGWGPNNTLGIELVCDALAKLMLITINFVALASIIFSLSYMRRFTKVWLFESLFLLMVAAMNGVVLAGDLFNLYVFIEVAAIASYALVGFGCESEELEASFKYLTLGTVGSGFILLGVTILYSLTGQLNMGRVSVILQEIGPTSAPVVLAASLLIGGVGLKAAMVPFHAWLPDAHPSAPAPISAMLSGVLIKASGVYVLGRIVFNVLGPTTEYAVVLMILGTGSMVIGVFLAVGQWDFKRLLAYHSISQMGYVVLAFGVAAQIMSKPNPDTLVASLCLFGGLFHMFNHAAFKSLLFLSSGSIEQQTGTRQLKEMGGLTRQMPVTSFCCRIGALSIAGIPPFNGFFSKLVIIVALAMAGHVVLSGVAVLVALMTLLSFVKVQRYALEGPAEGRIASVRESPSAMCVAMILLAIVCLVGGLVMVPLRKHLFAPAAEAMLKTTPIQKTDFLTKGAEQ